MVVVINPSEGKPSMGKSIRNLTAVTRVGLDLAKNAFQVHAVDATGAIVVARKLTRGRLVPFFAHGLLGFVKEFARGIDDRAFFTRDHL
jgi:hypothetical protein